MLLRAMVIRQQRTMQCNEVHLQQVSNIIIDLDGLHTIRLFIGSSLGASEIAIWMTISSAPYSLAKKRTIISSANINLMQS